MIKKLYGHANVEFDDQISFLFLFLLKIIKQVYSHILQTLL